MYEEEKEAVLKKYNKGIVFVYTGNGKGKTTAALGLALRALGHGCKVFVVQFMKGRDYGEVLSAKQFLPNLIIYQSGLDSFVMKDNPSPVDIELARQGLEVAKKAITSGEFDMVILDEINVALDFKLVPLEEVVELIKTKPPELDLGLTGRYAPPEIIELADLVTEMVEIKHPYHQGAPARKGFEY